MPYSCDICNKGVMTGMNVSHSHRRTKRIFKPNLQWVSLTLGGKKQRLRLCTRCIRSLYKTPKAKIKKEVSA